MDPPPTSRTTERPDSSKLACAPRNASRASSRAETTSISRPVSRLHPLDEGSSRSRRRAPPRSRSRAPCRPCRASRCRPSAGARRRSRPSPARPDRPVDAEPVASRVWARSSVSSRYGALRRHLGDELAHRVAADVYGRDALHDPGTSTTGGTSQRAAPTSSARSRGSGQSRQIRSNATKRRRSPRRAASQRRPPRSVLVTPRRRDRRTRRLADGP